jgi:nucleoside-diphosphate-sugar epimerase
VKDLVSHLVSVFPDREIPIFWEPARAGEILSAYSDISHAREALGYEPSVELEAGLAVTRDWFVNAHQA